MNVLIIGITGFLVGINKGHMDYSAHMGAHDFRVRTTWLSLILVIALPFWTREAQDIGALIGQNTAASWIATVPYIGSYILIWLVILFIAQITTIIRICVEGFLRSHFASLLDLPGRG